MVYRAGNDQRGGGGYEIGVHIDPYYGGIPFAEVRVRQYFLGGADHGSRHHRSRQP